MNGWPYLIHRKHGTYIHNSKYPVGTIAKERNFLPVSPSKFTAEVSGQAVKRTEYQGARNVGERNEVEATFGTGKRIYRANNIRAKRADTGASWVGACYFVKNIMKFFRELLYALIEMMEIIKIIPENTGIIRNQSRVAEKTPVLAIG